MHGAFPPFWAAANANFKLLNVFRQGFLKCKDLFMSNLYLKLKIFY